MNACLVSRTAIRKSCGKNHFKEPWLDSRISCEVGYTCFPAGTRLSKALDVGQSNKCKP